MKTTRTTQMIKIKGIPENKILIIRFDFTALLKILNLNLFYGLNRYFFPMLKYEKIDLLGILSVQQPLSEDKTYCPRLKYNHQKYLRDDPFITVCFYHFPMRTFKSLCEEQREIRGIKQISANFYSFQLRCKNTRINFMYMVGGEYDNLPPSTSLNR